MSAVSWALIYFNLVSPLSEIKLSVNSICEEESFFELQLVVSAADGLMLMNQSNAVSLTHPSTFYIYRYVSFTMTGSHHQNEYSLR